MKKKEGFDINQIDRQFTISELTQVICKRRGFAKWCTLPYPDHPQGCPNYNKRSDCPPNVRHFLDAYRPSVYIAALDFDFGQYLDIKRRIHPDWTQRAIRNPRHYQNHLRSQLKRHINDAYQHRPELTDFFPVYNPEGMAVNVHLTCQTAGLHLEWPPVQRMYRIALLSQAVSER